MVPACCSALVFASSADGQPLLIRKAAENLINDFVYLFVLRPNADIEWP